MKNVKNSKNQWQGFRSFLKKAWQNIWNSGGSIHDCPQKGRSAQDIRDEYAAKCPWKGDLF